MCLYICICIKTKIIHKKITHLNPLNPELQFFFVFFLLVQKYKTDHIWACQWDGEWSSLFLQFGSNVWIKCLDQMCHFIFSLALKVNGVFQQILLAWQNTGISFPTKGQCSITFWLSLNEKSLPNLECYGKFQATLQPNKNIETQFPDLHSSLKQESKSKRKKTKQLFSHTIGYGRKGLINYGSQFFTTPFLHF